MVTTTDSKTTSSEIKKINLDIPINAEGMTLKDLLMTFCSELAKNGMICAGVIRTLDAGSAYQIFGHQDPEQKERNLPVEIMKSVVDRLSPEMVVNIERISQRKA